MTPAEKKFKKAVRSLWAKGLYPSPRLLNEKVHGHKSSNLDGKEPQWRREVFRELGIPLQRRRHLRAVFERAFPTLAEVRARLASFDDETIYPSVYEETDIDRSATTAYVGRALSDAQLGIDPASGRDRTAIMIHGGNVGEQDFFWVGRTLPAPSPALPPSPRIPFPPVGPRRIKA